MGRLKVFYLDDELDLLSLFQDTFDSPKIEIITFSNSNELIRAASTGAPDVVFLDYRLPATTGLEVANQLPPEIKKVLITGDLNVQVPKGFAAVFTKPLPMNEIEQFLENLF